MKKKINYIGRILQGVSLCIIVVIISMFFSLFAIRYYLSTIKVTPLQNNNIVNDDLGNILTKITHLSYQNADAHNYSKQFDCTNFSSSLVDLLSKNNISAYCVTGNLDNIILPMHTWVEVIINNKIYPLEATSGGIIDDNYYIKHYQSLTKGICL